MSIGFCRDNFDLNKNAIIENKKKDYWVLDMFDGETYSKNFPQYIKYVEDNNLFSVGDIVGVQVDLENGTIQFYKNGQTLGVAFDEGPMTFRKGKIYPFVQLYKCKVSVYQLNNPVQVAISNMDVPQEAKQRMDDVYTGVQKGIANMMPPQQQQM